MGRSASELPPAWRRALLQLDLEQVRHHRVGVSEAQVVSVGQLLHAADLLLVLGEEGAELEEGKVEDPGAQAVALELTERLALAQDRELQHVGAAVPLQQPRKQLQQVVEQAASP